ncbi:MAG TPA: hypothetical protein ENN27_05800 [Candidatus Atribacteria bacterium]|nr:hypothetical protein [Candidatus Atribacteria bacterium]
MNKKTAIFHIILFLGFIIISTLSIFKAEASVDIINLFISLNNSTPEENIIIVDENNKTENVDLLVFDIEVQGGSVKLAELKVNLIIDNALSIGDEAGTGFCDGIINNAKLIYEGNTSQGALMDDNGDCQVIYYNPGILNEGINTLTVKIDIGPTNNSNIFQDNMNIRAVVSSNNLNISSAVEYLVMGNVSGARQYLQLPAIEVNEPKIRTLEATNISTTASVIRGELSDLGDFEEVNVYFKWRKKGDTNWLLTPIQNRSQEIIFESNLSNLTSNTEYEYRTVVEWGNGGIIEGEIKDFKTLAISSGGSSGGGSWSIITEPEEEKYKGDITGDGLVGILDFNLLMINWGKEENNNIADLNNDGRVDILDFNILMASWIK